MGGVLDRYRRFVVDRKPVVTGFAADLARSRLDADDVRRALDRRRAGQQFPSSDSPPDCHARFLRRHRRRRPFEHRPPSRHEAERGVPRAWRPVGDGRRQRGVVEVVDPHAAGAEQTTGKAGQLLVAAVRRRLLRRPQSLRPAPFPSLRPCHPSFIASTPWRNGRPWPASPPEPVRAAEIASPRALVSNVTTP